ncbi:MAG: ankyrin repeat domain-containing protein [Rhizobium sp.]|nr:MAG: ankyrin repeat domain-containing protein [Rhizobium sp.]
MRRRLIVSFAVLAALIASPLLASERTMNEAKLFAAASNDDAGEIRKLLATGVNIDARNKSGETPLLVATHKNNLKAAEALINAGADVNAKDMILDSPYLYAGARGHLEILKMTLDHGADLKSTNRFGGTALIPASERGHLETVRTLIKAGVDVDHVNNLGWTALIEAIILSDGGERHQNIVQALVDAKADVNLADGQGATPLQLARSHGYAKIADILVKAGAK